MQGERAIETPNLAKTYRQERFFEGWNHQLVPAFRHLRCNSESSTLFGLMTSEATAGAKVLRKVLRAYTEVRIACPK